MVGEYTSLAFMLPASAVIGYFLGSLLDKEFETTWIRMAGGILGSAAGLVQLIRQLMRDTRDDQGRRGGGTRPIVGGSRGGGWGAGWVIGPVVSALNFRWLKQLVLAIGGEAAKPRQAVFLGMRYVLLGGGAYVILKFSAISLPAALSGLFVSVAAVIVEIILELAYARNGTVDH